MAEFLKVRETTVTLWLRRGLIKGIKIRPHIWRIRREAVEEFIGR